MHFYEYLLHMLHRTNELYATSRTCRAMLASLDMGRSSSGRRETDEIFLKMLKSAATRSSIARRSFNQYRSNHQAGYQGEQ